MAVHIKLIKNNIKSSSSYGKYFAKAVSQGEVTLEDIAAEACRNSGFSEGSVVGVVTELQDILKQPPASSAAFCPQGAASKAGISSTTSATESKPSGRKTPNAEPSFTQRLTSHS